MFLFLMYSEELFQGQSRLKIMNYAVDEQMNITLEDFHLMHGTMIIANPSNFSNHVNQILLVFWKPLNINFLFYPSLDPFNIFYLNIITIPYILNIDKFCSILEKIQVPFKDLYLK